MSVYNLGLRTAPQEQRLFTSYQVGALVATPGVIKDEANSLNADVKQADAEFGAIRNAWGVVRDADLPPHLMVMDLWWHSNWVPFMKEWTNFWEDHGNKWGLANWYHNFWGASWEKVQEYRAKLLALRQSARDVGFVLHGPDPAQPKEGPFSTAARELWRMVKVLLYAGLAIAAGVLLWKFYQARGA